MNTVKTQQFGTGYKGVRSNDMDHYLWPVVQKRLAGFAPHTRVLDAGSGQGQFSRELLARGYDVYGIELDQSGVEHARVACPTGHFENGSVYDNLLDLFGDPFDLIVSLEVVEHLYEPHTFVKRIYEALKPGGRFVVSAPYNGWLKNVAVAVCGGFDRHAGALTFGGHIKHWSRHTLTRLLELQGFVVKSFDGAGRVPWLWKSMVLTAVKP